MKLDWKKNDAHISRLYVCVIFFLPIKYKCIVYRYVWGSETVNRRKKDRDKNDLHKKSL